MAYGIIEDEFWTGRTGTALRQEGGLPTQVLALYLFGNPFANMIGLYWLRLATVEFHLNLSQHAILQAFNVCSNNDFAFYDPKSSVVWVKEMARVRMGLPDDRSPINVKDKRVLGAQNLYAKLPVNPFLGKFYDRYHLQLHLKFRPSTPEPLQGASSPLQGASSPLPVTTNGVESVRDGGENPANAQQVVGGRGFKGLEASIRKERTKRSEPNYLKAVASPQSPARKAKRRRKPVENPADNLGVITRLTHMAIDILGLSDLGEIESRVKDHCADLDVAYDSTVVAKAVESAVVQRRIPRH